VAVEQRADMVFDDLVLVGQEPPGSFFDGIGLELHAPTPLRTSDFIRGNLAGRPTPGPGVIKPLIRRNFLLETGVRYDAGIRGPEDQMFVSQCLLRGARAVLVPSRTYFYRRLPDSLCRRDQAAMLENELRLIDRLSTDPFLPTSLQPVLTQRREDRVCHLASQRLAAAVAARHWRDVSRIIRDRPFVLRLTARQVVERARVRAALRSRLHILRAGPSKPL
jgi:hypothetical protein